MEVTFPDAKDITLDVDSSRFDTTDPKYPIWCCLDLFEPEAVRIEQDVWDDTSARLKSYPRLFQTTEALGQGVLSDIDRRIQNIQDPFLETARALAREQGLDFAKMMVEHNYHDAPGQPVSFPS